VIVIGYIVGTCFLYGMGASLTGVLLDGRGLPEELEMIVIMLWPALLPMTIGVFIPIVVSRRWREGRKLRRAERVERLQEAERILREHDLDLDP